MTDQGHGQPSDAWLIGANQAWRALAHAEGERANAAELAADRKHYALLAARRSAWTWRYAAVVAYAFLITATGEQWWHWSRWSVFPVVVGAVGINWAIAAWQSRRRKRSV